MIVVATTVQVFEAWTMNSVFFSTVLSTPSGQSPPVLSRLHSFKTQLAAVKGLLVSEHMHSDQK